MAYLKRQKGVQQEGRSQIIRNRLFEDSNLEIQNTITDLPKIVISPQKRNFQLQDEKVIQQQDNDVIFNQITDPSLEKQQNLNNILLINDKIMFESQKENKDGLAKILSESSQNTTRLQQFSFPNKNCEGSKDSDKSQIYQTLEPKFILQTSKENQIKTKISIKQILKGINFSIDDSDFADDSSDENESIVVKNQQPNNAQLLQKTEQQNLQTDVQLCPTDRNLISHQNHLKIQNQSFMSSHSISSKDKYPQIEQKTSLNKLLMKKQKTFYKKKLNFDKTTKYEDLALQENKKFEKDFRANYPEIAQYILDDKISSLFAKTWSKILFVGHNYNMFTCFWFMAFPGFPSRIWLLLEIIAEMIVFLDLIVRHSLKNHYPEIWQNMWVLHNSADQTTWRKVFRCIGSIPQTFIFAVAFRNNAKVLNSFWLACMRLFKILRFQPFRDYFDTIATNQKNQRFSWILNAVEPIYYLILLQNFLAFLWLIPARFEIGYGWYQMAGYYKYGLDKVPTWMRYIDAFQYATSTMHGTGFGNIVPSANFEWVISDLIQIAGVSIFTGWFTVFYIKFTVEKDKKLENDQKFERAKKYAKMRRLSDKINSNLRKYFKEVRVKFEEFKRKKKLLDELPASLLNELTLVIHKELISSVPFFQFSKKPSFIRQLCGFLEPQICITNDFLVYENEIAEEMYFIQRGVCEVIATDNKTTIKFLSKGCYFGEIGILLTGKRTCSVATRTTTILYSIKEDKLKQILKIDKSIENLLMKVAQQRNKVQKPEDIEVDQCDRDDEMKTMIKSLPKNENVFGENIHESNMESVQKEFIENMKEKKHPYFSKMKKTTQKSEGNLQTNFESPLESLQNTGQMPSEELSSNITSGKKNDCIQIKIWQTEQYKSQKAILVAPFSIFFWVWNSMLVITIFYDIFIILFALCFDFRFEGVFTGINIACYVIYMLDLFIRSKTAILSPNKICFDAQKVLDYYINTWLISEFLAAMPFEYLLLAIPNVNHKYMQWIRLLRFLKFPRILELSQIYENQLTFPIEHFRIFKLTILYWILAHFIGCIYGFIGYREYGKHERYDGQNLFADITNKNYVSYTPLVTWSKWDVYKHMFYCGSCVTGATMYGDWVPWTPVECIFTIIAINIVHAYWGALATECCNNLSTIYDTIKNHNYKTQKVIDWLNKNQFDSRLTKKVKAYQDILWSKFEGLDEQEILNDLPQSFRTQILEQLFGSLLQNQKALHLESRGALHSVIKRLRMEIVPREEFVIFYGEVANHLYFIQKGIVKVKDQQGQDLNTLDKDDIFGEIALISQLRGKNPTRTASVIAHKSNVYLAKLSKEDFKTLNEQFTDFRVQIQELADARQFKSLRHSMMMSKQIRKEELQRVGEIDSSSSQNETQFDNSFEISQKMKISISNKEVNA